MEFLRKAVIAWIGKLQITPEIASKFLSLTIEKDRKIPEIMAARTSWHYDILFEIPISHQKRNADETSKLTKASSHFFETESQFARQTNSVESIFLAISD